MVGLPLALFVGLNEMEELVVAEKDTLIDIDWDGVQVLLPVADKEGLGEIEMVAEVLIVTLEDTAEGLLEVDNDGVALKDKEELVEENDEGDGEMEELEGELKIHGGGVALQDKEELQEENEKGGGDIEGVLILTSLSKEAVGEVLMRATEAVGLVEVASSRQTASI